MGALILSFVVIRDEVVWEVLSEDFRAGDSRVVVF